MRKIVLLSILIQIVVTFQSFSQLSLDWKRQNANYVNIASTPNDPLVYEWSELSNTIQGVHLYIQSHEVIEVYVQEDNFLLNFSGRVSDISTDPGTFFFVNIDVSINGAPFFNIMNGSPLADFVWQNASQSITDIGSYNLKAKITEASGNATIIDREYIVKVVPASQKLFKDNFGNTLRLWQGNNPDYEVPILISEGYDAYNVTPQEFYRSAADLLFECGIKKGFKIYVLDYKFNSQDIRNSSSIYHSAINFISGINNNTDIVACGVSMGGIIARYCLARAEGNGENLPVSHFITIDSPHQGAHINNQLQDFIKDPGGCGSADAFKSHGLDNTAAKQLLIYNTFDDNVHESFYAELNGLNGDGYPHNTKNVGVSFSVPVNNPIVNPWLEIQYAGMMGLGICGVEESFDMTSDDYQSGSWLPASTVSDDNGEMFWGNFTLDRLANPTFIPHKSSLDLDNSGISKFPIAIIPNSTSFHDVVPSEVVEPIMNALIKELVYVQNYQQVSDKNYISSDRIIAGENVTTSIPSGLAVINPSVYAEYKAKNEVLLEPGFMAELGSVFLSIIGNITCDNNYSYQLRNANNSFPSKHNADELANEILIYPNPTSNFINVYLKNKMKGIYELNLIDIYGNVRLLFAGRNNIETIDISQLSNGIYFLIVKNPGGAIIYNHKIVVKK
ncbi:MAG TPA: T9SS type A sorting domain-containing protein [Bacteroidia bacterium]|nr:T9SS type A sorting domain-containing protein [Bacteroidia bacterium]HNU32568.1 T9SS type A sorting domain-containing protein [Bacteroidia bacterium]